MYRRADHRSCGFGERGRFSYDQDLRNYDWIRRYPIAFAQDEARHPHKGSDPVLFLVRVSYPLGTPRSHRWLRFATLRAMSETPNDASRRQPPPPNTPEPPPDAEVVAETPIHEEAVVGPASTEPAAASPEADTDRLPLSEPAAEAALGVTVAPDVVHLRPDRVAPSMAIGVMVLLLICTVLMFVAA